MILLDVPLPEIPSEVLSQEELDDCLERVRAHFADLNAGSSPATDVKILVLGNGRAGKTQLVRRLRGPGFPFQPSWDSTHGVQIASTSLERADGGHPIRLHVWDFGGQDIYHGTHALFTRTRAVFVAVWASDTEREATYERDGIRFRNHPLRYWVSYARHQGGSTSPLLIVQSKCDAPEAEARRFPVDEEMLAALPYCKELHYSAANDRGRASLDEALHDAVSWLHDPGRQGSPTIGAGRLRVQRRLETLRDADAARASEERLHRTVDQATFVRLCAEEGGVTSPALLLDYLHNCGVVFHRQGLFDDRIVLDQAWALDAIYAVFQRQSCYRHLRATGGRFTRLLLEAMVWRQYRPEEQRLFLSMMRSCGICFVHREGSQEDEDDTEYVAPDLLPDRSAVRAELDEKWDESAPSESADYRYAFTHVGLMRSLIARIGSEAGVNALYWRDGVCLYETTTRSHAILEYATSDDWRGTLRVRTQGGQSALLLQRLTEWVEEEQSRLGIAGETSHGAGRLSPGKDARKPESDGPGTEPPPRPELAFAQPPSGRREWFVSYAWGDATPEGQEREGKVDALCARLADRGIEVVRDKTTLHLGDSISRFMARIGRGDRVFVFLSDKYLRSPYCMFELFEIWRTSRREDDAFRERVRVYALADARISTVGDRIKLAAYWKEQHDDVQRAIETHGPSVIGESDFAQFKLMGDFYRHVSDVLALIADTVRPVTLDRLVEYGLDDLDRTSAQAPGVDRRSVR